MIIKLCGCYCSAVQTFLLKQCDCKCVCVWVCVCAAVTVIMFSCSPQSTEKGAHPSLSILHLRSHTHSPVALTIETGSLATAKRHGGEIVEALPPFWCMCVCVCVYDSKCKSVKDAVHAQHKWLHRLFIPNSYYPAYFQIRKKKTKHFPLVVCCNTSLHMSKQTLSTPHTANLYPAPRQDPGEITTSRLTACCESPLCNQPLVIVNSL